MSQTHIFNFFPGSIRSRRILKTLSLFASRQKNTYIPNQQVWLNKLYFQISNSKEKQSLTIDTTEINKLGPAKFRTHGNDGEEQTCYFDRNKSDTQFRTFQGKRVRARLITFSIVNTNSDFVLNNKSLDIGFNNSLFDGTAKKWIRQSSGENISNGRPKTDIFTESGNGRQRGNQSVRKCSYSRKPARKKPRFISE